jgi:hypothetical protein
MILPFRGPRVQSSASSIRAYELIKQRYSDTVLTTAWHSQNGNNWQISDKPNPQALLLDTWAITCNQWWLP